METAEAEIVEGTQKRDARGRMLTGGSERERVLAAFDASGMTQGAFARREGVKYHTLVHWLRERRRNAKVCAPSHTPPPPARFHEIRLAAPSTATVEVQLPDGTIARGGTVRELVALVKALRS